MVTANSKKVGLSLVVEVSTGFFHQGLERPRGKSVVGARRWTHTYKKGEIKYVMSIGTGPLL